jgi:hypothetical protein
MTLRRSGRASGKGTSSLVPVEAVEILALASEVRDTSFRTPQWLKPSPFGFFVARLEIVPFPDAFLFNFGPGAIADIIRSKETGPPGSWLL